LLFSQILSPWTAYASPSRARRKGGTETKGQPNWYHPVHHHRYTEVKREILFKTCSGVPPPIPILDANLHRLSVARTAGAVSEYRPTLYTDVSNGFTTIFLPSNYHSKMASLTLFISGVLRKVFPKIRLVVILQNISFCAPLGGVLATDAPPKHQDSSSAWSFCCTLL